MPIRPMRLEVTPLDDRVMPAADPMMPDALLPGGRMMAASVGRPPAAEVLAADVAPAVEQGGSLTVQLRVRAPAAGTFEVEVRLTPANGDGPDVVARVTLTAKAAGEVVEAAVEVPVPADQPTGTYRVLVQGAEVGTAEVTVPADPGDSSEDPQRPQEPDLQTPDGSAPPIVSASEGGGGGGGGGEAAPPIEPGGAAVPPTPADDEAAESDQPEGEDAPAARRRPVVRAVVEVPAAEPVAEVTAEPDPMPPPAAPPAKPAPATPATAVVAELAAEAPAAVADGYDYETLSYEAAAVLGLVAAGLWQVRRRRAVRRAVPAAG
jgi:hypothetical protein